MIHFVGRSCRLPHAPNIAAFERLLFAGQNSISTVPQDRWRKELFYHPSPGTKGKSYSFAGGFVDDIFGFDPAVFGVSPREAAYMDPQQRMLLQVVWEALEDACIVPADLRGGNTGVFVGASMADYGNIIGEDPNAADAYAMTGNALSVISNRVAHTFDLHGPSMTIDTACSSFHFALEAATKALRSGQIDMAIVGGVNAMLSPIPYIGFAAARMLSPKGQCHAFSANADGYVRAEGAVAFVLRRVDVGEENLQSYGELVDIGVNTSGQTTNIALPSAQAQFNLLKSVYDRAGIAPDDLAFVEAHGTGTLVGDPVEADALGRALGQKRRVPLPIGSVKTNIGHLEPAAGGAGILKALIALGRGELPPSLNCEPPNPDIPFDTLNLSISSKTLALNAEGGARYAGVSSFGFGGANAHAILAAPAKPNAEARQVQKPPVSRDIFSVSGFCSGALSAQVDHYAPQLFDPDGRKNEDLLDALTHFRGNYPHRLAVISETAERTNEAVAAFKEGQSHPALFSAQTNLSDEPVVFMFSGNGAQYVGMTLAALQNDPAFARIYADIDTKWTALSGWSLIEKLSDPSLNDEMTEASVAQPLLFADQIAMVQALAERGLAPSAVIGHSGGEVAAACCCGALPIEQALQLIRERSLAQSQLAGLGTMAALQASPADAIAALSEFSSDALEIAAINSQKSVTLVGPREDIAAFARWARKVRRWACVPLKVNYPFHSAMQDAIAPAMRAAIPFLKPQDATVPFFSSVTGTEVNGGDLDAEYWWSNMRQPVLFQGAMTAASDAGYRAYFEIGPNPVLTSYAKDCLAEFRSECSVGFATRAQSTPSPESPVLQAVARAIVQGCLVDKTRLAQRPSRANPALISYPFQNVSYRADDTGRIARLAGRGTEFHPLLGRGMGSQAYVWLNDVDAHLQPVFADHVVGGQSIMPGTGLIEIALAASARCLGHETVELRDLDILAPLPLPARAINEVRTQIAASQTSLRIATRPQNSNDAWRTHVSCRLGLAVQSDTKSEAAPTEWAQADRAMVAHLYWQANEVGLKYGPSFQRVAAFRMIGDDIVEVQLKSDSVANYNPADFILDPVHADAVMHGLVAYFGDSQFADDGIAFVPVHLKNLRIHKSGTAIASGRIHVRKVGARSITADINYFDGSGACVCQMSGLRLRATRIKQVIDLNVHAFGMDLKPVAQFDLANSPDTPVLTEIAKQATKIADRIGGSDETCLLLDAIANRIGYDLLAMRDGSVRSDGAKAIEIPASNDGDGRYVLSIIESLTASGLVAQNGEDLVLVADPDLPTADELIVALLSEEPESIHEVALLARLQAALPDLIKGTLDWSGEAVFGAAALKNVTESSLFLKRKESLLTEMAKLHIAAYPQHRVVRVAELTGHAPHLAQRIAATCAHPGLEFTTIVTSEKSDAMVPHHTGMGGLPQKVLTVSDMMEAEPFDLIVSCGAVSGPDYDAAWIAKLTSRLAPAGVLALIEQTPRDYLDMIFGVASEMSANKPETTLQDGTCITLPDTFGAATLHMVRADSSASAAVVPETGTDGPIGLPEFLTPFVGSHTFEKDADSMFWIGSSDSDHPLIVLAEHPSDDGDGAALISRRIMCLQDLLAGNSKDNAPIWLIIPDGAGYHGSKNQSPSQGAIWAFMRTAKNEHPTMEVLCIDPTPAGASAVAALAAFLACDTTETEIVLRADGFDALRVRQGAQPTTGALAAPQVSRLVADPVGGLDQLSWRNVPASLPKATEIVVEVAATGLNYRDVMWAMGLLPEEALESGFAGPTLGMECAGRVTAVGDAVRDIVVGDKVVAFGPGCFASQVTVDQAWAAKLPPHMGADVAATVPVAFFTAYYALLELARLQPDETVLIHGGAGGVGLAAIQIAQWRGATVIATAGSPVKRALLRSLGVPHVLKSRDLEFADEVLKLTDGVGVDVVLNSLAGTPMERSLGLLRPFGRFLELGKQDFYANTQVGLRQLKDNASYFGVDVDQLLAQRPALSKRLFAEMMQLFHDRSLTQLPVQQFDGGDVVSAFRTMQRSAHIGKIVVAPTQSVATALPEVMPLFKPDAEKAILIVGGAGGLGLILMDRWVRAGARSVVLMGRSTAPDASALKAIAAATAMGAEIRYVSCDITDRAALEAALDDLRSWKPLGVVVHTAMVLEDMRIADLTNESLSRTLAVKVTGARNLDLATRVDALDHFIVFTSMATLIGNHGQSAYVAANGYLEGLIRQRRSAGLKGLAVGWGAILDAGYLARDTDTAAMVKRFSGNVTFSAAQALHALDKLIAPQQRVCDDAVIWISPMGWSQTLQALIVLKGPTHGILRALGEKGGEAVEHDDLRDALINLPRDAAVKKLTGFLLQEIGRILRIPKTSLSSERPVQDYGMDSLMGVELGLATQQALGDDIPIMAISEDQSMTEIAGRIVAHLQLETTGDVQIDPALANIAAKHMTVTTPERVTTVERNSSLSGAAE